jgi:TonB family protein
MNKAALLMIEMSIGLMVSYAFYFFVLRKLTLFTVNRFYLLFSVAVSLIVPLLNFSIQVSPVNTLTFFNVIETVTITANSIENGILQQLTTWQWISLAYFAGAAFFLIRFLAQLLSLARVLKAKSVKKRTDNVVFIHSRIVPFSFFNRIYINPEMYSEEELEKVIQHEKVHIRQLHSLDCLFFELLTILFWFNPVVFRYRSAVKEVHEYLADDGVVSNGIEKINYQELLYQQASGAMALSIPNSFNYSLTKKRIIMLTKIKSRKSAIGRLIWFAPVLLGLGIVFACEKTEKPQEEIIEDGIEIKAANTHKQGNIIIEDTENKAIETEPCYDIVEEMPEYPGGENALKMFIAKNIIYPKPAIEAGITGKVYVSFTVNKNGKVENVQVIRGVAPDLDAEAVRVVSAQPQWTPGKEKGEAVNVRFTVPINFELQ